MFTPRATRGVAMIMYSHPLMPSENDASELRKYASPTAAKKNFTVNNRGAPGTFMIGLRTSSSRSAVQSIDIGTAGKSGIQVFSALDISTNTARPMPIQNGFCRKIGPKVLPGSEETSSLAKVTIGYDKCSRLDHCRWTMTAEQIPAMKLRLPKVNQNPSVDRHAFHGTSLKPIGLPSSLLPWK